MVVGVGVGVGALAPLATRLILITAALAIGGALVWGLLRGLSYRGWQRIDLHTYGHGQKPA